jgi:hypothetical protein
MEDRSGEMSGDDLQALNLLHGASEHLKEAFDMRMDHDAAQANLEARALLFRLSNRIFWKYGMGISREEIEQMAVPDHEVQPEEQRCN